MAAKGDAMTEATNDKQAPATVCEWFALLTKMVHVRIGPPKESHDVVCAARAVNEDGQTLAVMNASLHSSATVDFGVEAIVTGISFYPPDPPSGVYEKTKKKLDPMRPYGRLNVTVDVFLDKPIGACEKTERIDDE